MSAVGHTETRNMVGQLWRGPYHKGPFGIVKYICLGDKPQAFQGQTQV